MLVKLSNDKASRPLALIRCMSESIRRSSVSCWQSIQLNASYGTRHASENICQCNVFVGTCSCVGVFFWVCEQGQSLEYLAAQKKKNSELKKENNSNINKSARNFFKTLSRQWLILWKIITGNLQNDGFNSPCKSSSAPCRGTDIQRIQFFFLNSLLLLSSFQF